MTTRTFTEQIKATGLDRSAGITVDETVMFTNHKGVYKKAIEKRQRKLALKLEFLAPFLAEGETILLITTGCSPMSFLRQYLTGLMGLYSRRSLFVFTSLRMFHIPTTTSYKYRNCIAQVWYADCESIAIKWGKLVMRYKNGTKDAFICIPSKDRKKIQSITPMLRDEAEMSEQGRRTFLCPRCMHELTSGRYHCELCGLEFKKESTARTLALLPGGGYFYTGHWLKGIMECLVSLYLFFIFCMMAMMVVTGTEEMPPFSGGGFISLAVIGLVIGLEKTITISECTHFVREFIVRGSELK